jgi:hypothetical protein
MTHQPSGGRAPDDAVPGELGWPGEYRPRCRSAGTGDAGGGEAGADGACVVCGCGTSAAAEASWIGDALADGNGAADDDGAAAEPGTALATAAGAAAAW